MLKDLLIIHRPPYKMEMFWTRSQISHVCPNNTTMENALAHTKCLVGGGGRLLLETKFNKPFRNTYSIREYIVKRVSDSVRGTQWNEILSSTSILFAVANIIFKSQVTKIMVSSVMDFVAHRMHGKMVENSRSTQSTSNMLH